jgi:D-alanine-D-alanine ligase
MPVAEGQKLRIGFTFDSKKDWLALGYSPEECAEFNTDKEIEDVAGALRSLGYEVDIVGNIKSLTKRLTAGGHHWDFVFNVCEGSNGNVAREAHVPGLLEAWGIDFTFSDAATLALCLDKCKTKASHLFIDIYRLLILIECGLYRWYWTTTKYQPLHTLS